VSYTGILIDPAAAMVGQRKELRAVGGKQLPRGSRRDRKRGLPSSAAWVFAIARLEIVTLIGVPPDQVFVDAALDPQLHPE